MNLGEIVCTLVLVLVLHYPSRTESLSSHRKPAVLLKVNTIHVYKHSFLLWQKKGDHVWLLTDEYLFPAVVKSVGRGTTVPCSVETQVGIVATCLWAVASCALQQEDMTNVELDHETTLFHKTCHTATEDKSTLADVSEGTLLHNMGLNVWQAEIYVSTPRIIQFRRSLFQQ